MVLDRNASPYNDDYNEDKKYVQILFRPGMAVQARELSQIQSTLQKQVERFGRHVFKEGSLVIPGEVGVDTNLAYVKLEDQFSSVDINVNNFKNKKVVGTSSGAIATVIDAVASETTDPNTLFLKYETGNSTQTFTGSISNGSAIVSSISISANTKLSVGAKVTGIGIPANTYIKSIESATSLTLSASATATNATASLTATTSSVFIGGENIKTVDGIYTATTLSDSNSPAGLGSRVTINRGVYFALGYFCLVDTQSLVLDKYSNTPSYKVGLRILDEIVTHEDDVSLVDPANGSPNFNAPGADRYKIVLELTKYDFDDLLPDNFIELVRVKNGIIQSLVQRADYSELEKTLARRTNDESGSYTVRDFPISLREHLNDGTNNGLYSASNGGDSTKVVVSLEPGKAYVEGYEIEKATSTFIEVPKARDTDTENNAIIPIEMGSYIDVTKIKGLPNISTYDTITFKSVAIGGGGYPGITMGTAKVKAIEFISGTPGTTGAVYRFYLFDIVMSSGSFVDIKSFTGTGAIVGDFVLNALNEAQLYNITQNTSVYLLPDTAIKEVTDSTYSVKRYSSGVMTGNTLTLTAASTEIFSAYSVTNYQVTITSASATAISNGFANGDIINLAAVGNSVVLAGSPTGRQVVITIPAIAGSTIGVISTLTKSGVALKTKTLTSRTQTVAHGTTVTLDRADIYDLVSVIDSTTSANITNRFTLDNGQRDNYYDRGKIKFDTSYAAPAGNIAITYRYFEHGSGDYFSVNSYSGVIDYEDIQIYKSPSTGKSFDLRNALDFRPRVNNGGTDFSVVTEFIPTGQNFITDYEFYIHRIDKVFLDTTGQFKIISGNPAKNPVAPNVPKNGITLYQLEFPAYTFKPTDIIVKPVKNKRYTMADIGKLEQRVQNLELYTSLNLLEKDTADMFIDDGTGANRFKSGFLVDNFTSHRIGNYELPEYSCSIDFSQTNLRPSFFSSMVGLALDAGASTNYQKTGDLITLPYTTELFISANSASKIENINPYDIFNWVGNVTLNPSSDIWFDTERAPDVIIETDDGEANRLAALNGQIAWNEWTTNWVGTPISTSSSTEEVSGSRIDPARDPQRRVVTRTFQETTVVSRQEGQSRTGVRTNVVEKTTTQQVGDRTISSETIPFIRSKTILFTTTSLKPNTRVYPFFDNVNVSAYTKPTGGNDGDPLITNINGTVTGEFTIPNTDELRFRTGTRVFSLSDSPTNNKLFVTTSGSGEYSARGTIETKEATIVSTRSAELVTSSVTDERTIIGTNIQSQRTFTSTRWEDPIAQTFLVENQGGVFIPKIDIYFQSKDTSGVPVTLQIRNTVNGYPGQYVLPFSTKTLNPSSVNISEDASAVTSFVFDSPVYLQSGVEYCFVLLANSIQYNVWVGRIGEFDVNTSERISKQPYSGVMFKSQNASTWTADQEQDIKFGIHKCVFNTAVEGNVLFKNGTVESRFLPRDPFYTTDTSTTVQVFFPNHGLQDGETVTLAGATGTLNGVPSAEINGNKVINYLDFDSFEITVTTPATATGSAGGTTVTATGNLRCDTVNSVIEAISFSDTLLSWGIRARDTANNLHSDYIPFEVKSNLDFTDERFVFNSANEAVSKSVHILSTFSTDNSSVSPVIDTQRTGLIAISNRINNTVTDELEANSGLALARYITKKISLANPAISARVYLAAVRPPNANIHVYIKTLADIENDDIFDDKDYVELDRIEYPVGSENHYRDYVFEKTGLDPFSLYAIKIVMISSETSDVPIIRDFRTIALGT